MEASTFTLMSGDGAYFGAWLVPALILALAALCALSILVATRLRQNRFDAAQEHETSQLEKDKQVISKIFWVLDRDCTEENVGRYFDEVHHYAWMLTHHSHLQFAARIRDYDRARLDDFDTAMADFVELKKEAKELLGQ